MPMDYIDQTFGNKENDGTISKEALMEIKKLYGLEDNTFVGYLRGYWNWLTSALKGDLGLSFKHSLPVAEVILDHMWISFGVAIIAFVLEFVIAIPLGIKAATHQYGATDYATTVFAMIGISFPSFFLAILLIKIFSVDLSIFPITGLVDPTVSVAGSGVEIFFNMLWHMILPMITIVIISVGGLMRHARTNTLEMLNQDFVRTARAKGLSEKTVIYKHVFRNTMVPIVTMMAGILPSLFGGMMLLEQVFGLDGIGQIAYQALVVGDIPFIMGYNMFLAILTVLGTLLSDIAYMIVDPRIKISK